MTRLDRFTEAQDRGAVYAQALRELSAGRKHSHWMWFVFPQIAGLGQSPTARHFAIADLAEAQAYAAHPVLGPRLRECVDRLADHPDLTATEIFGPVDALKLRSSLTLFAAADPADPRYDAQLRRLFSGPDPRTLALLAPG